MNLFTYWFVAFILLFRSAVALSQEFTLECPSEIIKNTGLIVHGSLQYNTLFDYTASSLENDPSISKRYLSDTRLRESFVRVYEFYKKNNCPIPFFLFREYKAVEFKSIIKTLRLKSQEQANKWANSLIENSEVPLVSFLKVVPEKKGDFITVGEAIHHDRTSTYIRPLITMQPLVDARNNLFVNKFDLLLGWGVTPSIRVIKIANELYRSSLANPDKKYVQDKEKNTLAIESENVKSKKQTTTLAGSVEGFNEKTALLQFIVHNIDVLDYNIFIDELGRNWVFDNGSIFEWTIFPTYQRVFGVSLPPNVSKNSLHDIAQKITYQNLKLNFGTILSEAEIQQLIFRRNTVLQYYCGPAK